MTMYSEWTYIQSPRTNYRFNWLTFCSCTFQLVKHLVKVPPCLLLDHFHLLLFILLSILFILFFFILTHQVPLVLEDPISMTLHLQVYFL